MTESYPYGLFEVTGVEIEYAIVDRESLAVRPLADRLIEGQCGKIASEIQVGETAWSNELALHVIELKTNGPTRDLAGLAAHFQSSVRRMNELLEPLGAMLMPGSMHPFMDPFTETQLWPHEYSPVYDAFDRIFDCGGHGWSNVQSTHLNFPFRDDEEFGRLHAAIRLILPILPALSASSPIADGKLTGLMDTRLDYYRANARRIPQVTAHVVPEAVFTRADYEREVLEPIYAELASHDPEGVLRYEWINARGCIARFERGAIEIRVLDTAESPQVDVAIGEGISELLRALVEERWESHAAQRLWPVAPLADLFVDTIRDAERTRIRDESYLRAFDYPGRAPATVGELWSHVVETLPGLRAETRATLGVIVERGPLARRILACVEADPDQANIRAVYRELCATLDTGGIFEAGVRIRGS